MKIRILSTAEDDLVTGHGFYELQDPGAGDYFLDHLYGEIDSLRFKAVSHKEVFGKFRMLSKKFPFGIFYAVSGEVVEIHAVLDLRRKPSWLKRRLRD